LRGVLADQDVDRREESERVHSTICRKRTIKHALYEPLIDNNTVSSIMG